MTSRVRLRTPTRDDLPFIRSIWEDDATMEAVGGTHPFPDDRAERWFRRMIDPGAPTDRYFLIETADGRPVGEISFHRRDLERDTADLNVKILATERGQGYGHAALEAFLAWYFDELGAREIVDRLRIGNEAGLRLMTDMGFVHDPAHDDVHMLRLDRDLWRSRARG